MDWRNPKEPLNIPKAVRLRDRAGVLKRRVDVLIKEADALPAEAEALEQAAPNKTQRPGGTEIPNFLTSLRRSR